jgi:hypothetical protein
LAALEAAEDANFEAASTSSTAAPRGSRQRLELLEAAAAAVDDPALKHTPLTASLKRDWAAGGISAKRVQQYAMDAAEQGAHSLDGLAAAGSHGRAPQHIHKALLRIFGTPKGAPPIDWINLPGKDGNLICQPFLMPHKFFSCLYEHRQRMFLRHLRGPEGSVREYWDNIRSTEFFKRHPLLTDLDHTLPIGLHGDAGAFTKHDSLMVISWNGLLGRDCERTKRIVFTFVRKKDYTPDTLNRILGGICLVCEPNGNGQAPSLGLGSQAALRRDRVAPRWAVLRSLDASAW